MTIDSQSEAFMEIINGMGLGKTFDLVNPYDLEEILEEME